MQKLLYFVIVAVALFVSCSEKRNPVPKGESPQCCEDSAMAHFLVEPERSIRLLDSAVILKRLSPQRAEYLKAIVTYNGLKNPDSCITICQRLVDEKAWIVLPDSDDKVSYQVEVYELMAMAAYSTSDILAMQRYANAGIELAHGRKDLLCDEADLLSRVGTAMVTMGDTQEGFRMLDKARYLAKEGKGWLSVLAYLNISKKYVRAYSLTDDYEGVCRVAKDIISYLGYFKVNYKTVEGIPDALLNDSTAIEEFIQYYYTPATAFLTKAYVMVGIQDSAKVWYQRFLTSPQSENPAVSSPVIVPLISFGNYADALQRIEATKAFLAKDTLSSDYIDLLEYEQEIYLRTGRKDEALALSQRIHHLTDSSNKKEYKMLLANSAAQYKLQEEKQKRREAEEHLYVVMNAVIVVLLVIVLCLAVYP